MFKTPKQNKTEAERMSFETHKKFCILFKYK